MTATIVRAGEGQTYTDENGIRRTTLARPAPGIELVEFTIPDGAATAVFPGHVERATETVHVLTGRLLYRLGDVRHELHHGDTLTTRADGPHSMTCLSDSACTVHVIITSPR